MKEQYEKILKEHLELFELLKAPDFIASVTSLIEDLKNALKNGNKVLVFGNGGSAADAQHMAAELMGRFKKERDCLPVYALTTNSSLLTAIGNDYDFSKVFSRQLQGIVKKGDMALGISTSGNAANVIEGFKTAKEQGAITYLLSGKTGGSAKDFADKAILIPSSDTARIQEGHIFVIHTICEILEAGLF